MKRFLSITLTLTAVFIQLPPVHAQGFPTKPVRVVVGYPPGGASDTVARIVAQELSLINKQAFIVENKPGVGGMLSMSNVAKSLPDGYTLGIGVSGTLTTGPHLQKTKLYDPLTDFESIGMVSKAPMVLLAGPSFKYDSVSALIREAKARPGEIMFASGAQAFELALKLLNTQANINLGSIPYAGGAQASIDVLGGRVPLMVDTIGAQQENIKAGKLRALAMLDSKRSPLFPDVPTMAESGVTDYEAVGWISLVAAKGTPQPIVKKLNQQLQQVLEKPEVRQKLLSIGFEPSGGTPNDLVRTIQTDYAKWGQIIKAAGMTPQ